MAPLRADDLLADYPVSEGVFDEAFSSTGEPRPHARAGLEAVARADAAELPGRVSRSLKRAGVRFSSVEGDLEFYVDPVPRVITASDWEPVKRGLAQRVRALNAFVADVYGDQRIVAEGVIPREVVTSADYYEAAMRGVKPPSGDLDRRLRPRPRPRPQRRVARARGQRPHAERLRLPARHPPRAARAHRRPARRDAAPARRRDRPARRRAARRRARGRPRPPRAAGRGADRRRAQLRLLGARVALAPARHPAHHARRARGARRRAVAARPRPARAAPHRRHLPPHERRSPRLRHRPPADRARQARHARPRSTSTAPASPTTSSRTPTSSR